MYPILNTVAVDNHTTLRFCVTLGFQCQSFVRLPDVDTQTLPSCLRHIYIRRTCGTKFIFISQKTPTKYLSGIIENQPTLEDPPYNQKSQFFKTLLERVRVKCRYVDFFQISGYTHSYLEKQRFASFKIYTPKRNAHCIDN